MEELSWRCYDVIWIELAQCRVNVWILWLPKVFICDKNWNSAPKYVQRCR